MECLLLKYGLKGLPNWNDIPQETCQQILQEQGLLKEPDWREFTDPNIWRNNSPKKFIVAWQSVKAIRDSLREILVYEPPSMQPFYMALLQASLPLIYYQDDRFHNPNLQKLYLVLASGLLCERLL
jgi:hypothetical protein